MRREVFPLYQYVQRTVFLSSSKATDFPVAFFSYRLITVPARTRAVISVGTRLAVSAVIFVIRRRCKVRPVIAFTAKGNAGKTLTVTVITVIAVIAVIGRIGSGVAVITTTAVARSATPLIYTNVAATITTNPLTERRTVVTETTVTATAVTPTVARYVRITRIAHSISILLAYLRKNLIVYYMQ